MSYPDHIIHGTVDVWGNDVYYKIIRSHRTDLLIVVCLQWFDECDYDQSRFVRNSDGKIHVFETEDMAEQKLNLWYKPEEIDQRYRKKDLERDENVRE